jgi:hypothetical protein
MPLGNQLSFDKACAMTAIDFENQKTTVFITLIGCKMDLL